MHKFCELFALTVVDLRVLTEHWMKDPHKNRSVPPCFAVDSLLFLAVLVKRIVNCRVNPVVQHTSSRNLSDFITMKNIDDHNEKAVLRFLVCIAANCCGEAIVRIGQVIHSLTHALTDALS